MKCGYVETRRIQDTAGNTTVWQCCCDSTACTETNRYFSTPTNEVCELSEEEEKRFYEKVMHADYSPQVKL